MFLCLEINFHIFMNIWALILKKKKTYFILLFQFPVFQAVSDDERPVQETEARKVIILCSVLHQVERKVHTHECTRTLMYGLLKDLGPAGVCTSLQYLSVRQMGFDRLLCADMKLGSHPSLSVVTCRRITTSRLVHILVSLDFFHQFPSFALMNSFKGIWH